MWLRGPGSTAQPCWSTARRSRCWERSPAQRSRPPLLSGHNVQTAGQVVLGELTLTQLGQHVGGTVEVSSGGRARAPANSRDSHFARDRARRASPRDGGRGRPFVQAAPRDSTSTVRFPVPGPASRSRPAPPARRPGGRVTGRWSKSRRRRQTQQLRRRRDRVQRPPRLTYRPLEHARLPGRRPGDRRRRRPGLDAHRLGPQAPARPRLFENTWLQNADRPPRRLARHHRRGHRGGVGSAPRLAIGRWLVPAYPFASNQCLPSPTVPVPQVFRQRRVPSGRPQHPCRRHSRPACRLPVRRPLLSSISRVTTVVPE